MPVLPDLVKCRTDSESLWQNFWRRSKRAEIQTENPDNSQALLIILWCQPSTWRGTDSQGDVMAERRATR